MGNLFIIDEKQIETALMAFNSDDVEFVKKYKEKIGSYPTFRKLQEDPSTVGQIYPEHPKANIKLKTYVDIYLRKNLGSIVALISTKEGDLIPKKRTGKGWTSEKTMKTLDSKHLLRSELEVLAYNIFYINGVADEISVDDYSFMETCGKIPDFYWKKKNLVIEIAGLEDENYKQKINDAIPCFESLGIKPIIIWSRKYYKTQKYREFYLDFCKLMNFPINKKVLDNPYEEIGPQNLDKKYMQKFIDDNVRNYNKTTTDVYKLNKYIQHLYGIGLKEYQKKLNIPRYEKRGSRKYDIIKYKKENPHLSNSQIGNFFNLSKSQIQRILTNT
jgi:hypothetical protein